MRSPLLLATKASSGIGRATVAERFGRLDAVVTNAGFAVDGIFEGADDASIRRPRCS